MQPTNTLKVEIVATLLAVDQVAVRQVATTHLPWLAADAVFLSNVQVFLEKELILVLAQLLQNRGEELPRPLLAGVADVLKEALRRFGMAVNVWPRLLLEEYTPGLGEKLLGSLTLARDVTPERFLADERIAWRPYKEALEEHARRLRAADLVLSPGVVLVSLDRAPLFTLAGPEAFRLERIALFLAGQEIASRDCSETVEPVGTAIELPEIPVTWYPRLRQARSEAELALWVGADRRRLDGWKVRLALPDTATAPHALFVDLGSTTTKTLRVVLRSTAAEPPTKGWSAELKHRLTEVARMEEGADTVFMPLPTETSVFLAARGLPAFDKAALDGGPPEALAAWLAASIRGLAVIVAQDYKAALSHVFWSFPQTSQRDFEVINAEVNRRVGHLVLAGIRVIPEHDCLRLRFGTILKHLARLANRRQQERRDAEEANADTRRQREDDLEAYATKKAHYDSLWISWLWTPLPVQPSEKDYVERAVPALEDWYGVFLTLKADTALEEVLIIDAGGFSLDVFARVGRGDEARVFPESFRTGGAQMTEGVRAHLAAARGCQVADVTREEAELRKCEACLEDGQELSARCHELTAEVYRADLRRLADWAKPYVEGRAMPVILTGGAMANLHLRALLREEFEAQGIVPVYTSSVELYGLLDKRLTPKERSEFQLFYAASCAFSTREQPRLSYDIVSGLAQAAMQKEGENAS